MSRLVDVLYFGVLAIGVVLLATLIFTPLIIAGAWYFDYLSFELAAILLLVIAAYAGGS